MAGKQPADDVNYRWVDDGYTHPRLPTADYIRAEAVEYFGSGKKRYWNPQHERYMEFIVKKWFNKVRGLGLELESRGQNAPIAYEPARCRLSTNEHRFKVLSTLLGLINEYQN